MWEWFHSQIVCSNVRLPCLLLIRYIHIIFTCNPIIFEDIHILLFHSIQNKMLQCENVFRWILVGKTSVRIKWQTASNHVTLWGKIVTLREERNHFGWRSCHFSPKMTTKGQLISKGLFADFIWTKNWTKNFCPEDIILLWVRA